MKVLKYILYIYLFIGSGFAIKYNYDYAKENSFGDWLMFGEIVSTLKGFAWPYYLLDNSEKQEEKKNLVTQMNLKTLLSIYKRLSQ